MKKVSEPTLRRLPTYLGLIDKIDCSKLQYVSTTFFAEELSIQSIQVRKDLAVTGIIGKPKLGYDVKELKGKLRSFLGWDDTDNAFLIGAGNLGRALIGYKDFNGLGLKIIAAFDTDKRLIGSRISGIDILPVEKLQGLIRRMHINIGIITVPEVAAQDIADLMVQGGMKAIWNFTKATLNVPENIIVENVRFASSLSVLKNRLREAVEE